MTQTIDPPVTAQEHPPTVAVVKRDGTVVTFDAAKIGAALSKAFRAVEGDAAVTSSRVATLVSRLTGDVTAALTRRHGLGRTVHVEEIQDQVELALMRSGEHAVARSYVLYREEHARARDAATLATQDNPSVPYAAEAGLALPLVTASDGSQAPLDLDRLRRVVTQACEGLDPSLDPGHVLAETVRGLYDGVSAHEVDTAVVLAARALVETEPDYSRVAARLLLDALRTEVLTHLHGTPEQADAQQMAERYPALLAAYVTHGIGTGQLDPRLAEFDLDALGAAIVAERDLQFTYLGLQTLADRYLLHTDGVRFELPQLFFLRVAMGLALNESDRTARAAEFYHLISSFDFMCSTPTLFNAGTTRPQLSSCFLTTVEDDLGAIFGGIRDNALLAKFSGGLGNDWTPIRGSGSLIRGTNGRSSGVVPFLKVANDTAVAVNQGGKRKGAACAYLETWHIDIEEFLDLRKNTGDERRRTHDMNTANWIPDLFLQRVEADDEWTLFSPDETPDLHDLVGAEFEQAYVAYEQRARDGLLRVHRTVRAVTLWRRMLTMLFETGHPWVTFKDACNLRSPQQHAGVVHSSNLCTEITLNTSADEVAVCNLGSVNLPAHVDPSDPSGLDTERLTRTVTTAVRMLDNVIDINLYTIPQARRSNLRHRPIGLGVMGFQDALFALKLPYAAEPAVEFADLSMELVSHAAINASADLAAERGRYESFDGSLWSRGVLPIDSLDLLAAARPGGVEVDRRTRLDWGPVREKVTRVGMRNSNVMAIAPTATISNIVGVSQSIEPQYRNLYVKANMSGDFTVIGTHLVADLKARGLWDEVMVSDLKFHDGSLAPITRVPDDLKALYATAFEVEPEWLVRAAARRQKWIDQAQSLNLYVVEPDGKRLDALYRLAWRTGLKTTYYLRSTSRTHVEKSTLTGTDGRLNAVPVTAAPSSTAPPSPAAYGTNVDDAQACSMLDPDCEACQ